MIFFFTPGHYRRLRLSNMDSSDINTKQQQQTTVSQFDYAYTSTSGSPPFTKITEPILAWAHQQGIRPIAEEPEQLEWLLIPPNAEPNLYFVCQFEQYRMGCSSPESSSAYQRSLVSQGNILSHQLEGDACSIIGLTDIQHQQQHHYHQNGQYNIDSLSQQLRRDLLSSPQQTSNRNLEPMSSTQHSSDGSTHTRRYQQHCRHRIKMNICQECLADQPPSILMNITPFRDE
ncbi:hypothetical protein BDA99DRAFT_544550 [Phascolomyces articulosus]|uniref:Uncharacterized protein n=1 Tax=Phascolomyces articulosus TaxID=60185 RepID=A0AAD5P720_9FUNG|nr:hypothetical protein BDA99DRAFT_544550 [Phascolomyces articulosus]